MKLKWKVQPKPTGRYASFQYRGWPELYSPGGSILARIHCSHVAYSHRVAKQADHDPLTVYVYHCQNRPNLSDWLGSRFATLSEAKAAAEAFFAEHPDYLPSE